LRVWDFEFRIYGGVSGFLIHGRVSGFWLIYVGRQYQLVAFQLEVVGPDLGFRV